MEAQLQSSTFLTGGMKRLFYVIKSRCINRILGLVIKKYDGLRKRKIIFQDFVCQENIHKNFQIRP